MSLRDAQRPLVGPPVREVEVVLGEDRDGRQVVSLRPAPLARSGVVTITSADVLRDLIGDLSAGLSYLSDPYYRTAPPLPVSNAGGER